MCFIKWGLLNWFSRFCLFSQQWISNNGHLHAVQAYSVVTAQSINFDPPERPGEFRKSLCYSDHIGRLKTLGSYIKGRWLKLQGNIHQQTSKAEKQAILLFPPTCLYLVSPQKVLSTLGVGLLPSICPSRKILTDLPKGMLLVDSKFNQVEN